MTASKLTIITLLTILLTGCASTHPGHMATTPNGVPQKLPLRVSAQNIKSDVQTKAFQLIQVTIENPSDQWVRVGKTEVLINDPQTSKLSVVVGSDLKLWAEAMQFEMQRDAHNRELFQAGLILAGGAAMAAGGHNNNQGLAAAGALTVIGTYGWAVGDSIASAKALAERTKTTPASHLYEPFAVPAGMFLRRWILVNKPSDQQLVRLAISMESIAGEKDIYEIPLIN